MKQLFLSTLLSFFLLSVHGQNPAYDFELLNETYTDLEKPVPLVTGLWDDPELDIQMSFPFSFLGNTDVQFVNEEAAGLVFTDIDNPDNALVGFFADLIDRGSLIDSSLSSISYEETGAVGNRVYKLEWKNAGFYDEGYYSGAFNDFINVQVWFYESDQSFEIRYGASSIVQEPDNIYVFGGPLAGYGIFDGYSGDARAWLIEGDPTKPDYTFYEGNIDTYEPDLPTLNKFPDSGTVFRFSPSTSVSTKHLDDQTSLTIYPTIVGDELNLNFSQNLLKNSLVRVVDLTGKIHQIKTVNSQSSILPCQNLAAGIYFLQWMNSEGKQVSFKFIKK